ncbi:MAG: universal stress protein [Candidatus Thiothrix singaporensis]|uniref:Universal stress protein n=1 Tax=Candidatus Thiothrix singaporensis TaxID=2799669 RepID=A0A7L6ATD2_9GAMM|nr:MAG: universal stress protein [Candidatus Thiothrix singaporensis]
MQRYQHVLAPVDFSARSSELIKRAREIAETHDARLTLLHVVQDAPVGAEPFGEPSGLVLSEEIREQHLTAAQEKMRELAEQYDLPLNVDRVLKKAFQPIPAFLTLQTPNKLT